MTGMELTGEALVQFVLDTSGDASKLFGPDGCAQETALKRAYKQLALRLHPDKNPHVSAHEAFQIMQQSFEATLAALPSAGMSPPSMTESPSTKQRPPPPPPPPMRTRKGFTKERSAAHTSWAPPPTPPPTWPPKPHGESPKGGEGSGVRFGTGLGDDLFEIPLPPDVFESIHTSVSRVGPLSAQASATHAKPLPSLDVEDGRDGGDAHTHAAVKGDWVTGGSDGTRACAPTQTEANPWQQQQQAKRRRGASRMTLQQLFAAFNIDDAEEDGRDGKSVSSSSGGKAASQPSAFSSAVACPFCGAGGFAVHCVSAVVCQTCHGRFVPHAVGMTSAEREAVKQRKRGAEKNDSCACGRAKKGLCFLCD